MTDEMIALARRAAACKGWRWMPGMLSHHGERQLWCSETEYEWSSPSFSEAAMDWRRARFAGSRELPDLTDAATLGCVLALVREAWGSPGFYTARGDVRIKDTGLLGWDFFGYLRGNSCKGMLYRSEAEALVAALEGAP